MRLLIMMALYAVTLSVVVADLAQAKSRDVDPLTEFKTFSDALVNKIQQALQVHKSFTTSLSEVERRYDSKYK